MPDIVTSFRSIFDRARSFWSGGTGTQEGSAYLLIHFIASLRAEFLFACHPTGGSMVGDKVIVDELDRLLKDAGAEPTWERAYQIERLLVYVRPADSLAMEVEKRVSEAILKALPLAPKFRTQLDQCETELKKAQDGVVTARTALQAAPTGADKSQLQAVMDQSVKTAEAALQAAMDRRRSILSGALDDLQWSYQKRNVMRRTAKKAGHHMMTFGFLSATICALPFLAFLFERLTGLHFFSGLIDAFPNFGLYTAVSFGLLGAFFSRLTSLNAEGIKSVEDFEARYDIRALLIRGAVGMSGAMIMYFLLRTGILNSLGALKAVAPDLEKLSYSYMPVQSMIGWGLVLLPSPDWCILVMWSFLAGFSEKLVPDTLTRVESQATPK